MEQFFNVYQPPYDLGRQCCFRAGSAADYEANRQSWKRVYRLRIVWKVGVP
jgi:hypothetical protein